MIGTNNEATAEYNISVLDENDNTPTFLNETFVEVVLPEDAPVSGVCVHGRGQHSVGGGPLCVVCLCW